MTEFLVLCFLFIFFIDVFYRKINFRENKGRKAIKRPIRGERVNKGLDIREG